MSAFFVPENEILYHSALFWQSGAVVLCQKKF